MNKTKEELKVELKDINEDEIDQVTGGSNETIHIRELEAIGPYSSNEHSTGHSDWSSNNDVPSETGNYKIR